MTDRAHRGGASYHAGVAAEELVARAYADRGSVVLHRRWRGPVGEIDLIVREGQTLVFVEVKQSKTYAGASARISPRQVERVWQSASAYLERDSRGQLAPVRFDVALVNGAGGFEILENAFDAA